MTVYGVFETTNSIKSHTFLGSELGGGEEGVRFNSVDARRVQSGTANGGERFGTSSDQRATLNRTKRPPRTQANPLGGGRRTLLIAF